MAIVLTALLVIDLARNLRTSVISEAYRALTNAVGELADAGQTGGGEDGGECLSAKERIRISREIVWKFSRHIRMSRAVICGMMRLWVTVSRPTQSRAVPCGSRHLNTPKFFRRYKSRGDENKSATRIAQDGRDLVVVAVRADPGSPLAAWTLRRIFNFSNSNELYKRMFLVSAMLVALVSICVVLRLSFSLQRGFALIQAGLERLQTDLNYRLPDQDHSFATSWKR